MKNTKSFAKLTAVLCAMALLGTGLAGCGLLPKDVQEQQTQTEPTQVTQPLYITAWDTLMVYEEPEVTAQIVGSIPQNTQMVIEKTVWGVDADGAPVIWGRLTYHAGWVILYENNDASQDTPTQPSDTTQVQVVDLVNPSIASDRYHIPHVDNTKFAEVNRRIQQQLMPFACELGWDDIGYCVGRSGDVVTILVMCEGFSDDRDFYVYYFSSATGAMLTQEDVLRQFDLDKQQFAVLATERTEACFIRYNGYLQEELAELYAQMRQETLDNTLTDTKVFIDANGNLGFVAYIGVPAGSGHTDVVLSCWENAPVTGVTFPK